VGALQRVKDLLTSRNVSARIREVVVVEVVTVVTEVVIDEKIFAGKSPTDAQRRSRGFMFGGSSSLRSPGKNKWLSLNINET